VSLPERGSTGATTSPHRADRVGKNLKALVEADSVVA
jgi:hypothetical protein